MSFALVIPALAALAAAGNGVRPLPAAAPLEAIARVPAPRLDTVVTVRPGDRVRIEVREGRLVLEGVEGDRLSVEDEGGIAGLELRQSDGRVDLRPRERDGRVEGSVRIRVPRGLRVEVTGRDLDVRARGIEGGIRVDALEGDLRAEEIRGDVELRTLDGDIDVRDVVGAVSAATVDGEVRITDVEGAVLAESMDGDVVLDGVDGDELEAVTVDGDVHFEGAVRPGTRIRLVTHDGDVVAVLPPSVSLDVEVSTFDGEFIPEFPVRVGRVEAGQPLRFRLGDGGAWLDVEVFDGDIQLRHGPGR